MTLVVPDPNILVSAVIAPTGTCSKLLAALRAAGLRLVISPHLVEQLTEVLQREKFRRYVTIEDAQLFVERLRQESLMMADPEPNDAPIGEDPGDEYLVWLTRSIHGACLISGDRHLTRLSGVVPVQTPREFLDELAGGTP